MPETGIRREAEVPLDRIDLQENTYRITTRPCTDDLTASVRLSGLINLPILKKNNSGFSIVSGFRRVEACRRCGFTRIRSRIFPQDAGEIQCIRTAVAENALQRPLNPVEASRVVALFSRIHPDPEKIEKALGLAGFPLHRAFIEKLILLNGLPDPVRKAVAGGLLTLTVALDLAGLEADAAVGLTLLFDRLKMGFSLQREMIGLLTEIARRDGLSPSDLLKDPAVETLLADEKSDRVQKTRRIRWYFKKRRFPSLTEKEEAFRRCIRKLKLGPGVSLSPPRDFEGPGYALTLQFDTLESLADRKNAVERILRDPEFKAFVKE